MVDDGATYATVEEKLGIAPSTMCEVMKRRDSKIEEEMLDEEVP